MAALWAGHLPGRPGQTAHFHGREGTFSLPPIQPPSATPWLSSVLAPSSRARLVPVYLRQAPPGPTQLQEASRQQLSENPEAACKTAMLALSLVILSLLSAVLPASCQQGKWTALEAASSQVADFRKFLRVGAGVSSQKAEKAHSGPHLVSGPIS
ncbi:PDZK1-interacting protein 1 isoform X3 [Cavia porcellus]|uniref:PDZK1-interacting protein 1 isoform X3 n=1 Tax=Cavia porcellus TaxID=10141 RepID=UPI002FE1624B